MFSVALLLLLAAGSCVKCEQLTQPESATVQPGQRLSITCQVSYSVSSYYTHWIRQPAGKEMDWIAYALTGDTFFKDSLKNKFSIMIDSSSNTVTLIGQNMQPEDSAVYYCAKQSARGNFDYWGKGTEVTVTSETPQKPKLLPMVSCQKETQTEVTVGCLAYDFTPKSITYQWTDAQGGALTSVQYPPSQKGNTYARVSSVKVSQSEWTSKKPFTCTVNSTAGGDSVKVPTTSTVAPVPTPWKGTKPKAPVPTKAAFKGTVPKVTVHILPEEDQENSEISLVCLVSCPVQQKYKIRWSEDEGFETGNYGDGIEFTQRQIQNGFLETNVYLTTKEKWAKHKMFYCVVGPADSNITWKPRGVSTAIGNSHECRK